MQRFADESNPEKVFCKKIQSTVSTIHVHMAHAQPIIGGSGCETYLDAAYIYCAGFAAPQLIFSGFRTSSTPQLVSPACRTKALVSDAMC